MCVPTSICTYSFHFTWYKFSTQVWFVISFFKELSPKLIGYVLFHNS